MIELLRLRREAASLLGYRSYAELSLEPKMPLRPTKCWCSCVTLRADRSRRATGYGGVARLCCAGTWAGCGGGVDVPYASERLRQRRYAYSEQELKQYFPEHRVLAGLFKVIETLFSVVVRPTATGLDTRRTSVSDRVARRRSHRVSSI